MPKSRLRIFAGPNGSGKSTLFESVQNIVNVGAFVNADRIEQSLEQKGLVDLSDFGIKANESDFNQFLHSDTARSLVEKATAEGLTIDITLKENFLVDQQKSTHSYEAALAAMFIRNTLLKAHHSFSYETVMSHPSKISFIEEAKIEGFKTYLYFICTDDPLINIKRIDNRVIKGGHAVNPNKILTRYSNTLRHIKAAIAHCDRVYFFDNSEDTMRLVAQIHEQQLTIETSTMPNWFAINILEHYA